MHFQLPSQLQREVVKYDSTFKSLAKFEQQYQQKPRKKPTYPRGNVISLGLIPDDIVKLTDQQKLLIILIKRQQIILFLNLNVLKK